MFDVIPPSGFAATKLKEKSNYLTRWVGCLICHQMTIYRIIGRCCSSSWFKLKNVGPDSTSSCWRSDSRRPSSWRLWQSLWLLTRTRFRPSSAVAKGSSGLIWRHQSRLGGPLCQLHELLKLIHLKKKMTSSQLCYLISKRT